jgi:hypothetical protein
VLRLLQDKKTLTVQSVEKFDGDFQVVFDFPEKKAGIKK